MCGRFVALSDVDGIVRFLEVEDRKAPPLERNYNVAPTQDVHAAAVHDGVRHLVTFRWGLVPSWAKDPSIGARMINARAETLLDKPAFRPSLERRRCLLPAAGFYEWERRDGVKVPHFITHDSGEPLAFAGLWASWRRGEERLLTTTIVTTAADGPVTRLHDRMPVALPRESWATWLDLDLDVRAAADVVRNAPTPALTFRAVSTLVNDHRNNGPQLLEPADAA